MNKKGKSKALNLGIKKARGEILALTDDDCIVDKKWLENIYLDFQKDLKPVMVLGRVLPDSPRGNQGLHCISINKFGKKKVFADLKEWYKRYYFFSGSNMSIKKEVFDELGYYKEWLGVGSIGKSAEDVEISYRILKNDGKILFDPSIIAHHSHWLTSRDYNNKLIEYMGGVVSVFSYYMFKKGLDKEYLINFLEERTKQWEKETMSCIRGIHPKAFSCFLWQTFLPSVYWYTRGFFVGAYYAFTRKD
jgi:GT2 family glycosyltransferase